MSVYCTRLYRSVHFQTVFFFLFSFLYSHRFTKIEVDPQVKTPEGKYYDVLFIGTGMSFNVPVDSKNSIDIFVYFFFAK